MNSNLGIIHNLPFDGKTVYAESYSKIPARAEKNKNFSTNL